MGGSVTIASMLPIMLISIKYGIGTGLSTAFLCSATQLVQAWMSGNVFHYCETPATLAVCILFDYVIPFTVLGLACLPKKLKLTKNTEINIYIGIVAVVLLRFICHFVTGVVIWGQWAPDGMGKYLYSLLYNGGYMLPETILTVVGAILIFRLPGIRKILKIKDRETQNTENA
jgi:thiamine transporter